MKALPITASASLCAVVALALTSPATSACGGRCELPTDDIEIAFPEQIEQALCNGDFQGGHLVLEGAVHRDGASLVVVRGKESFSFPSIDAAIPEGTLVRVTMGCTKLVVGYEAHVVWIRNAPSLGETTNPTESGERTWLFAINGYLPSYSGGLPTDFAFEEVCEVKGEAGQRTGVEALVLVSGADVVYVPPGETRPFTIHRGAEAGAYDVQNVNITFDMTGVDGIHVGEYPLTMSYRLTRAE
ncbi:MAG: hypothetical protein U0441_23040 [Polyangiaceae bacterium]